MKQAQPSLPPELERLSVHMAGQQLYSEMNRQPDFANHFDDFKRQIMGQKEAEKILAVMTHITRTPADIFFALIWVTKCEFADGKARDILNAIKQQTVQDFIEKSRRVATPAPKKRTRTRRKSSDAIAG